VVLSGATEAVREVQAGGGFGEDAGSAVQSISRRQGAPFQFLRVRILLGRGPERGASGEAPDGTEEAAERMSADQGMDQGESAQAGR